MLLNLLNYVILYMRHYTLTLYGRNLPFLQFSPYSVWYCVATIRR